MASKPDVSSNLSDFQHRLDIEALIRHGVSHGFSETRLRAILDKLKPIFDGLSMGEQPAYEQLKITALAKLTPDIEFVARSMSQSPTADLKTAGFQIMGLLDSESFIADLQAGSESEQEWQRIEAIRALGRMKCPKARPILMSAGKHPDLKTRRAATEALKQ